MSCSRRWSPTSSRRADVALRDVLSLLRARTGHDFAQYKRATVLRRIERRLQVNQLRDLADVSRLPARQPGRDAAAAERHADQRDEFLPRPRGVRGARANRDPGRVRRQVHRRPGARLGGRLRDGRGGLFDRHAARASTPTSCGAARRCRCSPPTSTKTRSRSARAGIYPEAIVTDVPPVRLRRFFMKEPGGYRVQKQIREMVMFAPHNLIKDPPFSRARSRVVPQPADLSRIAKSRAACSTSSISRCGPTAS